MRKANLSHNTPLISAGKNVCSCFTSNRNCPLKNGETPNGLLIFFRKTHIPKQIMDIVEKSYNNNGKPWKSSMVLGAKPKTSEIF